MKPSLPLIPGDLIITSPPFLSLHHLSFAPLLEHVCPGSDLSIMRNWINRSIEEKILSPETLILISDPLLPFLLLHHTHIFSRHFSGVRPLSRNEIKKDIHEIDASALSDNESTISVLSEDILNSSYPVKPRRFPKGKQNETHQRVKNSVQKESEIDLNNVEETIDFLRVVEAAKPEIFEAEKERENLEIQYQALRELCSGTEDNFKKRRFMMENYLRIIQTSTRNLFTLQDTMSLHNSLLYDLLISLKSRRKTLSQFGLGSKLKQELPSPNSEDPTTAPIYFYVSQVIETPDGIGTVLSIDKQKQSVLIYFPEITSLNFPPAPLPAAVFPACSTKEYSCLALYNYFRESPQVNLDAYHLQNLEKKWSYQSVLSEIPLEATTPFQHNLKDIHKLTEDDLYSLIQPSQPTPLHFPASAPPQDTSQSSKKTKRNSKSSSHEEISASVPTTLPVTLSSPLSVPLRPTNKQKATTKSSFLLFLKPGTLPYVVERVRSDTMQETSSLSSRLSVELSAQAYSSSTYTHHALPDPYDDSFFESIGLELETASKYQTVNPSAEIELLKIQAILKPLLEKIRECREETKLAALQVERSKMGSIRQSLEMNSIRLGLFTHQLLMKSQSNGLADGALMIHDSRNHKAESSATSSKKVNNNSKKKTKSAAPAAAVTSAPAIEPSGNSLRPKRKKDEQHLDQIYQDFDEEEFPPHPVTATASSKSKRSRR